VLGGGGGGVLCAGRLTHLARLGTVPTSEWAGGKRGTDGIWRSLDGIRSWLVAGRSVIGGRWWSTVVPNSYSANLQAAQRMSWVSLVPQCPQVATFSTFSMAIRECHIIAVSLDDAGGNVTAKPHTPAGLPPPESGAPPVRMQRSQNISLNSKLP